MIREHGFKTYEEAKDRAIQLLWDNRDKTLLHLTTRGYTEHYEDGSTFDYPFIADANTGAAVYFKKLKSGEFMLTFLTAEENSEENRTYPFRDTPKQDIPLLVSLLRAPFFKPVREIKPDEALTLSGIDAVNFFYGDDDNTGFQTKEEVEATEYNVETAFDIITEEEVGEILQLNCMPFPQALTELTGVEVKSASDYARGLSKLLNVELTEEQEGSIKDAFNFDVSFRLIRYATYEFFRTENYEHLRDILAHFGYLRQALEDSLYIKPYGDITPEEYVLAKYLSLFNATTMGRQPRLRDVAEYTGTPLDILYRASKITDIYE